MAEGIAVIGLAGLFPGAPDVHAFWRNIEAGRSAIRETDGRAWEPVFLDPHSSAVDRVYTNRGGFLDPVVPFDAGRFGVMPVAARGAEPDQLIALQVAAACLEDAGYDKAPARTGVILGRGAYATDGLVRLQHKVRLPEEVAGLLRALAPELDESVVARVRQALQEGAGEYGPDSAIGLVPNLVASRIANRLDLHGPAYTLDAACASSLIAVEHAVGELRSGRCELVLAGGVHITHDITFWSVFAQLGALSRSGEIRPFDQRADGLLIGEGIGMLALKRLSDAERDGDRIYAVLRGVGSASDGRASSVMVPRVSGQVEALRRAWADADLDPGAVGLLEAHGTATPAGDQAELATLSQVFGPAQGDRAVIGSVKSMIGHAMPAAGAAGLIKAVLAVYHGVLPPTLNCEQPHEQLAGTRFEPLSQARAWDEPVRTAAVNAFGFGGINAHVVLQSHGPAVPPARAAKAVDAVDAKVLTLAADGPEALLALLDAGGGSGGQGVCRLAIVDPTPARIERARTLVARGTAWTGRGGIWFRPRGLASAGGKVALLFPGIEAQFEPEVDSVAQVFDLPVPPCTRPRDLEETGVGVIGLGRFLLQALERMGVSADVYAGHSIGEWSGMIASGMLPSSAVDAFLERARPGSLQVPGVLFAAAGCGLAVASEAIAGLPDIAISHDNCPHQVILCGVEASVQAARTRLVEAGVVCQVLPFRSGFHSPLFADYLDPHRANFAELPLGTAHTPLWSATTCAPYPHDLDDVRTLALRHLVEPLRFRGLLEALYDEGVRLFVQVGTGSLTGFIDDTLADRPHLAVAASEARRPGVAQLRNLGLALWVEGVEVSLEGLVPAAGLTVPLRLGSPLLKLDAGLQGVLSTARPRPSGAPPALQAELARTLASMQAAGEDVVGALGRGARRWSRRLHLSLETHPTLVDHSLFPQPEGWSNLSDGFPVVPMTMTVDLLLDAARGLAPGKVPVALTDLQAFKWLAVDPAVQVTLTAEWIDTQHCQVEVVGYARATVRVASEYPPAPAPRLPALVDPEPSPVSAANLYDERCLFHGPAYQGVSALGPLDETGIDGVIQVPEGRGSLLDNAGQLLGFWLMARREVDLLAMPIGMDTLTFFGPHPPVGALVTCRVRITEASERVLSGDLELIIGDRLWCRIDRWADRRFATDRAVWHVMRWPERYLLSTAHGPWVRFDAATTRAPSRDWLMRRYLGAAERAAQSTLSPREQRAYLDTHVAMKDAVRHALWAAGIGPLFPVEVRLDAVSCARDGEVTVAIAGTDPGIALRPLDADPGEVPAAERALLPGLSSQAAGLCLLVAKQAAARAMGLDPEGSLRGLVVQKAAPERIVVDGRVVHLARVDAHLVAWTLHER